MKKTFLKKLLIAILLLAVEFTTAGTAIAEAATRAANHPPYGYCYEEASSHKTIYRFYTWNIAKQSYQISRDVYSRSKKLYYSNGNKIDVEILEEGSDCIGFDGTGNIFIGAVDTSVKKIDVYGRITTVLSSGFIRHNYNKSDIITSITTTSGRLSIEDLKPLPEIDEGDDIPSPPAEKLKNRLELDINSAGEIVIKAYKNGNIKTKLLISKDEKKVLNQTAGVRLTDILVGAKFLNMDDHYNVYLYEENILYRFLDKKWYSPQRIVLDGQYVGCRNDDKSKFLKKIITTNGEYSVNQLATSDRWKASKTYVVEKKGYKTLYTKGSASSDTLTLKSGVLRINGKRIRSNVIKYEFFGNRKFTFMTKNRWTFSASIKNPTKLTLLCKNGKSYSQNKNKLATYVSRKKGKKIKLK